ncbi:hypothetical protein pb186bvf_008536 [Paramecium bursaria]
MQLFTALKDINIQVKGDNSHTFIVFGQQGKSTMISKITQQNPQSYSGLLYQFQKININGQPWSLQYFEVSGQGFKKLITLPLTIQSYKNLTYVIILDLSDEPQNILNVLDQELQYIKKHQDEKLEIILNTQLFQEFEQSVYSKLENHHDRARIRPSLIPIIVVGWKYDEYAKQLDTETRKWITRGLRYLAHINNCSLVFGHQGDFQLVKQQLQSQVYGQGSHFYVDHLKPVSVSRLMDNFESIQIPTGGSGPLESFNKILKEQVSTKKKVEKRKVDQFDWDQYKEDKIDRLVISIKFKVQPDEFQCVSDFLAKDVLFYAEINAENLLYKFTLSYTDLNEQEKILLEKRNEAKFHLTHIMEGKGEIQLCFEVENYGSETKFSLNYESGGEAHDFDQIATKGNIYNMDDTLTKMEELQRSISREQNLIIDIEGERNKSFVDVSTKIIGFAGVTFGLLIVVAACQICDVQEIDVRN